MIRLTYRALILVLVLAAAATAKPTRQGYVADSLPKQLLHGAVGLKFGFLNAGRVTFDSTFFDLDAATCGGVFFDVPVGRSLMAAVAVDIYDIRLLRLSERYIDVSLGFKRIFHKKESNLAFKPGVAVGLGYLADISIFRPSTFLTVKWYGELMLFPEGKYAWVFDLGWFYAPIGGWGDHDLSIAPSLYLRAGLAL